MASGLVGGRKAGGRREAQGRVGSGHGWGGEQAEVGGIRGRVGATESQVRREQKEHFQGQRGGAVTQVPHLLLQGLLSNPVGQGLRPWFCRRGKRDSSH